MHTVETIQRLKEKVKSIDADKPNNKQQLRQILTTFLQKEECGIEALLTLCGLSDEKLYRTM
jgi:ferritin-like protein